MILGQITSSLYRRSKDGLNNIISGLSNPASTNASSSPQSKTDELVDKVQILERKLWNWYDDIPDPLRVSENMTYPAYKTRIFFPEICVMLWSRA